MTQLSFPLGQHVAFVGDNAHALHVSQPGSYFGPVTTPEGTEISAACVLPFQLPYMIAAASMDFPDIPSPMDTGYAWPGIIRPRAHQRVTAGFAATHHKCFILNEMGTGKTASALWAADYLMSMGYVRKVLVLGTLSTLYSTWETEASRLLIHRTKSVVYGTAERRKKLVRQDSDFYILNHDGLAIVADELIKRGDIDLVIIDEGSYYRNAQTDKYKMLAGFLKAYKDKQWLWVLTAQPCPNEPPEAFALAKLVSPHRVPRFYGSFRDMTMLKVSQYKYVPKPNAMDTVFAALQPAIRFRKADCVDLPPTTYVMKQAQLSDDQRRAYRAMRTTFVHQTEDGTMVKAPNAAVQVGKLLQIAAGVVKTSSNLDEDDAVLKFDVSSRLKLVLEFVEESQSKTVVLVPYVAALSRLVKYLEDKGYSCGVVDGSVTGTARAKVLEAFSNQREPRVLVCNPKAASHGLNLQVADTLVFYSPVLSLDTYLQAKERIARPGQQHHMVIGEIAATKLEARFYDALRVNERFSEALLGMYDEVLDETVQRV